MWTPVRAYMAASARVMLILALGTLAWTGPAYAMKFSPGQRADILAEAEAAFDSAEALPANSAQARRDFLQAARKYQLLIDSGVVTGKLYYNLGNAYLQAGRLGQAIVNYKRAARLMGDNEQLRENLRYARSLVKGARPVSKGASSLPEKMGRYLPIGLRVWLALAAWLIFWFMMTARLFWPTQFRWRYSLLCSVAVFILLAGSVAYELYHRAQRSEGVITASAVHVLRGNGEGFARKFDKPIAEGTEFDLIARRKNWLNISLADGKTGWVRAEQAELVSARP